MNRAPPTRTPGDKSAPKSPLEDEVVLAMPTADDAPPGRQHPDGK
jgi:hypothetical protein